MQDDREELKQKVRAILQEHQGPDNSVTMYALWRQATGGVIVPGRKVDQTRIVRSLVEQLRREGCPIGLKGGPNGGYFWARNDEELQPTIAWFHERAMSSLKQESTLKRMQPDEVIKQYAMELNSEETQQ